MDLAKERGEKVVSLKHKRDNLEKERSKIMDDLETIQKG
jgi:hypothetical protein